MAAISVVLTIGLTLIGYFSSRVAAVETAVEQKGEKISAVIERVSTVEEAIRTIKIDNQEIKNDIKELLKRIK